MHLFVQQLINGLSLGAIYALIAVGYTMVYGVLRLINFAHGDVFMFGAMMGLFVATSAFNLLAAGQSHPMFWLPMAGLTVVVLGTLLFLRFKHFHSPAWLGWLGKLFGAIALSLVVMDLGGRLIHRIGIPSWSGLLIVILSAMIVCACLGVVIEMIAYRPLRNRPRINSLITAIGVSMFLEYGGQGFFGATMRSFPNLVPTVEGPPNPDYRFANLCCDLIRFRKIPRTFDLPLTWLKPSLGHASAGSIDALVVFVTIVLMAVLTWIVLRTRTGMALRAVSFRFDTAALMGIDINRIITLTFALGSALAGAAGVMYAIHFPKVDPLMGLKPGITAFVAAVLGGIGNIPGAVAGGFLLGLIEVLVSAYLPQGTQYKDAIAFVILIAILLVKPTGIFGRNTVEKV